VRDFFLKRKLNKFFFYSFSFDVHFPFIDYILLQGKVLEYDCQWALIVVQVLHNKTI